jgi:hypothetical protein
MSTPGLAPEVKKFGWKRLFIKTAAFGAGFALTLAAVVGGALWLESLPKREKPWDHSSVSAEYDHPRVLGEKNEVAFGYILTNNTDKDFRISSTDSILYNVTLVRQKAIATIPKDVFKIDLPILVPAHQRAYLNLGLTFAYSQAEPEDISVEERNKFRREVEQSFEKKYENIKGFQLLLEEQRVAIDLPGGWKKAH